MISRRLTISIALTCLLLFALSSQVFAVDNHLPVIKSVDFADPYIYQGIDIEIVPKAYDEDDDDIYFTYRWFKNGQELPGENTAVFSGDNFVRGDRIYVWIIPSDQYGAGKTFYGSEFIIPNAPPKFETGLTADFQGDHLNFTARAYDPDDANLIFQLANEPAGMTINQETGEINWHKKADQIGPFNFEVIVLDPDGAKSSLPIEVDK